MADALDPRKVEAEQYGDELGFSEILKGQCPRNLQ
jgi:hypothetical protein